MHTLLGWVLVFIGLLYLYGLFLYRTWMLLWKRVVVFMGLLYSMGRCTYELVLCTYHVHYTRF